MNATTRPGNPPHATLLSGPVGCGKTRRAIEMITTLRRAHPLAPVWVLVPSQDQLHTFQERLVRRAGAGIFGVEMFRFEELYGRVLDLAGDPQRMIDDATRYHVLRRVAAGLHDAGQLALFGAIVHLPGFIALLAGLFDELKQSMVEPEDFSRAAVVRGAKDRDLARMYDAYQHFLQHHRLIDRHGAGWLAVEHLQNGTPLDALPALLVVDGFDHFTRVQLALITALARRIPRSVLTLTAAPDRPGRYFRRLAEVRANLLALGDGFWQEETLALPPGVRAPALDHLAESLFSSAAVQVPGGVSVALVEAPDVGREVAAVLRRVKRLLLDGVPPEEVAVLARDLPRYSAPLRETARAYGVPLVVREGIRLRENPAVAQVLALLNLSRLDFPRRDVLDALRSPYIDPPGLDADDIAWLERISLLQRVVRGRAAWLEAVRSAGQAITDEDGETRELLDEDRAAALAERLDAFFTRITPERSGTVYDYVAWLEDLLGPDPELLGQAQAEAAGDPVDDAPGMVANDTVPVREDLGVIACIRATDDAPRVVRDINALRAFKNVLYGLRSAHDLLALDGDSAALRWDEFRQQLRLAVDHARTVPQGGFSRLGRVLATSAGAARGLPHDHVFILGLAEGVFPAQERESDLYQDHERRALADAGADMITAHDRPDDMSLFYQIAGLARQNLTLSRFTVDDKGTPVPASPYWRAVRSIIDVPEQQIERVRIGAVPALGDSATMSEAAVAVAARWSAEHTHGATGDLDPAAVHNALLAAGGWAARWRRVLHGRVLESQREDVTHPFDQYDGRISDPALLAQIAERLGPEHRWSASQLTEYGTCPFRFFARRLLLLEELEEPEEGLDALQFGSLNHAILEDTYQRIADEGLTIAAEHCDRALAILAEEAARVLDAAPHRFGFRPSAVWHAERDALLQRLQWLVQQDFSDETPLVLGPRQRATSHPVAAEITGLPRVPFRQEAAFGRDGVPLLDLNPGGDPILVAGVIDRIDRAGDVLILIDYKTGTRPHNVNHMRDGRDFQMMVYLEAARAVLDTELDVIGGLFWHVRNRKVSGEVLADDPAVDTARELARQRVLDARAGRFVVQPNNGQCAPYCEFEPLCRLNRAKHRKSDW